jgi:hypothetical protein
MISSCLVSILILLFFCLSADDFQVIIQRTIILSYFCHMIENNSRNVYSSWLTTNNNGIENIVAVLQGHFEIDNLYYYWYCHFVYKLKLIKYCSCDFI